MHAFWDEVKGRHCKRGGGQRGWGSEVKDKNRIGKGKRRGSGESELLSEGNSLFWHVYLFDWNWSLQIRIFLILADEISSSALFDRVYVYTYVYES